MVRLGAADGLLIWHIDEEIINRYIQYNEVNANECHKGVDLECADAFRADHCQDADGLDRKDNRGDATDPWYSGNDADFYTSSIPDNRDYRSQENFNTTVEVRNISASGNPMTADLKVGRVTYIGTKWYNGNGQTGSFTVPQGDTIRIYYLGWNCCANTYVYEQDPGGAWTKVNTWCWNVPRHSCFSSGNEIRQQVSQWSGQFRLTSYSLCGAGTDIGYYIDVYKTSASGGSSPGNGWELAGWGLGFQDSLWEEFGYITEPVCYFSPALEGIPLTEFPAWMGPEWVEELNLEFEIVPNIYWERMVLAFTVAEVSTPGPITILCPDAEFPETEAWIDSAGYYEVYLGWIHAEEPTTVTIMSYPTTFAWDWMNLMTLATSLDLTEPPNGTVTNNNMSAFGWSDITNATAYHLQIDDNSDFSSPVINDSTLTSSMYTPSAPLADALCYWRVRARTAFSGWSNWSYAWNLTIDTQPPLFSGTTVWPDTSFGGPYPVNSFVTDNLSGVDSVFLYYRFGEGDWESTSMVLADSLYEAEIPGATDTTIVDYYLKASDFANNESTDPDGAPANFYGFVATPVGIEEEFNRGIPTVFALSQNLPNPFTSTTSICYQLPVKSKVSLKIYSVTGQLVRTLVDTKKEPGYHKVNWNGRNDAGKPVSSGIYFYRLEAGGYTDTRKLILMR